jgi:predicted transposase YbfD/YdcC
LCATTNSNLIKASLGIEASGVKLIDIDGKQANGTGRKRGKNGAFPNLQTLNVYDASSGICLAAKNIETIKAHSKVERRNFYLTTDVGWFEDKEEQANLRAFVCFEKILTDTNTGEVAKERRLFISSVKDAELCAEAIRGHWAIENRLHWHLDFSFGDDNDMTTDKNAYLNFSLFRRMALTICKMSQPFMKCSIKTMRWGIGLEP